MGARREQLPRQLFGVLDHQQPAHHVFQLPQVARPLVFEHGLPQGRRKQRRHAFRIRNPGRRGHAGRHDDRGRRGFRRAPEVIDMKILISACLAACSLYGQSGTLASPSLGYVFDPSAHALRRIQGIPGAALVGTPLDFGVVISAAYVAPRLDAAFVVSGDGQAHFFRLTAAAPQERAVDSLGAPLGVVFSPSGSAAALYWPGNVQMIKGLPDAPVVAATIALRGNPRPRRPLPDTLAISDDGAYLLYAAGGPMEL